MDHFNKDKDLLSMGTDKSSKIEILKKEKSHYLKETENNPQFDQENILSARKFQKKKVLRESFSNKFYFETDQKD